MPFCLHWDSFLSQTPGPMRGSLPAPCPLCYSSSGLDKTTPYAAYTDLPLRFPSREFLLLPPWACCSTTLALQAARLLCRTWKIAGTTRLRPCSYGDTLALSRITRLSRYAPFMLLKLIFTVRHERS